MPSKRLSAPRILVFVALVATGLYIVCIVGLTVGQRRLLYYPCTISIAESQPTAAKIGFQPWANATGELIGWFRRSPTGAAERAILLLHGNAGCASGWFHYAQEFQSAEPIDFYILEYPGYAGRVGKPTQSTILRAVEDAFVSIPQTCSVCVVGESLGTGPACYLAGKHAAEIKGVFLVAPYNIMTRAAGAHLPLFPVKLMLKDKYPSDQWLKDYHGPLAIMLGGNDTVIPSELGRSLFDGYRGPKTLWLVPSATHDDLHSGAPMAAKEVLDFWRNPEASKATPK